MLVGGPLADLQEPIKKIWKRKRRWENLAKTGRKNG